VTTTGLVNLDFADIKAVMEKWRSFSYWIRRIRIQVKRAVEAVEKAIKNTYN
jgi:cell division GTPase FtsZ